MDVKYLGYNSQYKKLQLSRKALLPPPSSDTRDSLHQPDGETAVEAEAINNPERTDGTKM